MKIIKKSVIKECENNDLKLFCSKNQLNQVTIYNLSLKIGSIFKEKKQTKQTLKKKNS